MPTPVPHNPAQSLPPSPQNNPGTYAQPTSPVAPLPLGSSSSLGQSPHVSQTSEPQSQSHNSESESSSLAQSLEERPRRFRRPNKKYFNDKFVNISTIAPISPALEPSSVRQALQDARWKKAMEEEFEALMRNGTCELVPRGNHTPVGCKWVYRVKPNIDGRLVAKGFLQEPGRDYFETFSLVIKPVTVRIILSIALSHRWPIRHLDINNAFLNGVLSEDVYMEQPVGFVDDCFPGHICRLKKAIYGLKQAPRAWYLELSTFLLFCGFHKSLADSSIVIYRVDSVIVYFLVYVDDIVLTSNNAGFLDKFIGRLAARFSLKDFGLLHHFLGVEVIPTYDGLFLSQSRYILDIQE